MRRSAVDRQRETLLWILGGLVMAGIVHIVSVILLPSVATRDTFATISAFGPEGQFNPVPTPRPGSQPLVMLDPNMRYAVCHFSIDEEPLRIEIAIPAPYWSLALYSRGGINFFSVNNRAAEKRALDLRLMTPLQSARLKESPIVDLDKLVLVDAPVVEGFALIRAFVGQPQDEAAIVSAMAASGCAPFELPERAPPPVKTVEPLPQPKPRR
ncbi:MAG: DUF1254 domain-containing protein [Hyphomicrobiales bacterium]